jgi:hypothetical protein
MRRRTHVTRWALLAALPSIATRRVFAANNCFLIAATCVGEWSDFDGGLAPILTDLDKSQRDRGRLRLWHEAGVPVRLL